MYPTHNNFRAISWVIAGISSFTVIGGLTKHLSAQHSGTAVLWVGGLLTLLLAAPWALRQRARAIRSQKPGLHLLRALFNTLSALCALYALPRLSLGEVTFYQLTTPIWLIPLALIFLGEAVRPMRWLGVAVSFAGVWIVAAPGFDAGISLAVMAILASAVSDALLGVLLKQGQHETPMSMLWWTFSGKTLLFGLLSGFALPQFSATDWLLLASMAVLSLACMLCFIHGYRSADATVAETGSFAGLLVGPLAGWLMFGETLGNHYWLGAAVLTAGILLALFEPALPWRAVVRNAKPLCLPQSGS
ncbi:DMT family transporter [Chitinimonas sp.]|uniref:DMT family transporter n=1 Tax=Chitinimonas sp. TaxID=1934313 RepID=UPI0035AFF51C